MAYAVPSTARLFSSVVRDVVALPESGTSAALYAGIEELSPRVVFLSPLLSSEIETILSMDPSRIVAMYGEGSPKAEPRLYVAEFSRVEAARLAGAFVAAEVNQGAAGLKVAAIFSGSTMESRRSASEAFNAAFLSAGGTGTPSLELVTEDYSHEVARKLASLDIRAAYVSAPPDTVERWVREAFDPFASIIAEYALPSDQMETHAGALVTWDVGSTLKRLSEAIEASNNERIPGTWSVKRVTSRHPGKK
jgi:hypothetical protein